MSHISEDIRKACTVTQPDGRGLILKETRDGHYQLILMKPLTPQDFAPAGELKPTTISKVEGQLRLTVIGFTAETAQAFAAAFARLQEMRDGEEDSISIFRLGQHGKHLLIKEIIT